MWTRRVLSSQLLKRSFSTSSAWKSDRSVYLYAGGLVPVTRNLNLGLDVLAANAAKDMLTRTPVEMDKIQGVFVGNMMSGILSKQQHLGPLVCDALNLHHCEAATAEACCGAGGASLRWGFMALKSGELDNCLVVGVEQMTHAPKESVTEGLATASHWPTEGGKGETFVSLNAILMDAYMKRYNVPHSDFFQYSNNAHLNGNTSDHAIFKEKYLDFETFENCMMLSPPIQLFDAPPTCDGAAVVALTTDIKVARASGQPFVEIVSSAAATDILPVRKREDPLVMRAVEISAKQAISKAGLKHDDIDIFELHDAYSSMACLSIENAGFVEPGEGIHFAKEGNIRLDGKLPIATFGGLKSRGHPVGATGVYQAVEMFKQLTNQAGENQVKDAEIALIQNIGGAGASVFAHTLRKC